jgi:hypothetical protein
MVDETFAVGEKRITMTNGADTFTITMRKRPWWFWVSAGLWLLVEILLLQTAVASADEGEVRAATISWIAAAVLAAVGALVWLRRGQFQMHGESNRQAEDAATST